MTAEFYNYLLNVRGYSPRTVNSYRNDLRYFIVWAKITRPGIRWSTLKRSDLDAYISDCAKAGKQPSTTNRYLSSISALYKWMRTQGYEVENPARYESRRKVAKKQPNTIDTEELRTAYEHAKGLTKIMLGLLMATGIRIQELLDLEWEDIDFKTHAIRIHGKGMKERTVFATAETLETLDGIRESGDCTGRMFHVEQREARHMIFEALRPYCHAKQLSPHAIRHTFATDMAMKGANVSTIGRILGHEHIETTQKYIDLAATNIREAQQVYTMFN